MDSLEQLPQLEALCERLYNAQDHAERTHAESVLLVFSSSSEYAPQCKAILDNSSSPYAQLLASSSLLKIVTEQGVSKGKTIEECRASNNKADRAATEARDRDAPHLAAARLTGRPSIRHPS